MNKLDKLDYISVPPLLLGAMAEATVPEDNGRLTLNMLVFDRNEIVACNGHIAVRYRLDHPREESFPTFGISRAHVEAVAKALPRAFAVDIRHSVVGKPIATFSYPKNTGNALTGMQIIVPCVSAADYPSLDLVLPAAPTEPAPPNGIAFDPRYLDLIYRIAKHAGFESSVRVASWGGSKRDSILLEAGPIYGSGNPAAALRFVLMPVAHPTDLSEALSGALK